MPILLEKWRILTWPHIGPKFNFHHLQKISTELKITVLTPNWVFSWNYSANRNNI